MNKDAMREAFELNLLGFDLDLSENGKYIDEELQEKFRLFSQGWQAALSQQQAGEDELLKGIQDIVDSFNEELSAKLDKLVASHRARKGE